MPKRRNKLADYLQYLALRVLATVLHMFDIRANYRAARWLADWMFRLDGRHRRMAIRHLELSFPDWPAEKYRQVARDSMRNTLYLGVEFLFTPRLITPASWHRHLVLHELGEPLRLLLERHSGAILLTGHFGNWEVSGYVMATLGFPSVAIARRLDNPYLDRFVYGVRERTGQVILDKRGAAGPALKVLSKHGMVGFVADQDAGPKGPFVDFFGRLASTYKAIALLAMRHDAPVLVGYAKRLGEQYKFEIGVQRIILPEEWAGRDDPVMWITQEYTRALENVIRSAPEQYIWTHRRWRHRPKGEQATSDGVA